MPWGIRNTPSSHVPAVYQPNRNQFVGAVVVVVT